MLTLIVIIYYVWLKLAKIGDIIQMFIDEFLIDSLNKMEEGRRAALSSCHVMMSWMYKETSSNHLMLH